MIISSKDILSSLVILWSHSLGRVRKLHFRMRREISNKKLIIIEKTHDEKEVGVTGDVEQD